MKQIANQLYRLHAFSEAEATWRQCASVLRQLLAKDTKSASTRELLAHALHNRATCLLALDRPHDALSVSAEAAELRCELSVEEVGYHLLAMSVRDRPTHFLQRLALDLEFKETVARLDALRGVGEVQVK